MTSGVRSVSASINKNRLKKINSYCLLPSGSEKHKVLQVGSIQEGILKARH